MGTPHWLLVCLCRNNEFQPPCMSGREHHRVFEKDSLVPVWPKTEMPSRLAISNIDYVSGASEFWGMLSSQWAEQNKRVSVEIVRQDGSVFLNLTIPKSVKLRDLKHECYLEKRWQDGADKGSIITLVNRYSSTSSETLGDVGDWRTVGDLGARSEIALTTSRGYDTSVDGFIKPVKTENYVGDSCETRGVVESTPGVVEASASCPGGGRDGGVLSACGGAGIIGSQESPSSSNDHDLKNPSVKTMEMAGVAGPDHRHYSGPATLPGGVLEDSSGKSTFLPIPRRIQSANSLQSAAEQQNNPGNNRRDHFTFTIVFNAFQCFIFTNSSKEIVEEEWSGVHMRGIEHMTAQQRNVLYTELGREVRETYWCNKPGIVHRRVDPRATAEEVAPLVAYPGDDGSVVDASCQKMDRRRWLVRRFEKRNLGDPSKQAGSVAIIIMNDEIKISHIFFVNKKKSTLSRRSTNSNMMSGRGSSSIMSVDDDDKIEDESWWTRNDTPTSYGYEIDASNNVKDLYSVLSYTNAPSTLTGVEFVGDYFPYMETDSSTKHLEQYL